MKKFKVEFKQTETFYIDVYAKSEKAAQKKAEESWDAGDYEEAGDCKVEVSTIYDVTHTDDPFHPVNEAKEKVSV